jgi:hypothetical protein
LITIRFLLRYLSRPLHFFGTAGMLGILLGSLVAFWLALGKLFWHTDVMTQHGPLMIFSAVLMLGGVQLLGLGLLGEMQARYHHESPQHVPYSIERVLPVERQTSSL